MSTDLFSELKTISSPEKAHPALTTPLGEIATAVRIGDWDSSLQTPDAYRSYRQARILHWEQTHFCASLLQGPFDPQVPMHPQALTPPTTWALIWRVRCKSAVAKLAFTSQLDKELEGSPASGENLDAIEWDEDPSTRMHLGTEDDDALSRRASANDRMPSRLQSLWEESRSGAFVHDQGAIRYLKSGLQVEIPSLLAGESIQVHFIAAWEPATQRDHEMTWMAVEQDYRHILSRLF